MKLETYISMYTLHTLNGKYTDLFVIFTDNIVYEDCLQIRI